MRLDLSVLLKVNLALASRNHGFLSGVVRFVAKEPSKDRG